MVEFIKDVFRNLPESHRDYSIIHEKISYMDQLNDKLEECWSTRILNYGNDDRELFCIIPIYNMECTIRGHFLTIFSQIRYAVWSRTSPEQYNQYRKMKEQIKDYSMYAKILKSINSKNGIGYTIKEYHTASSLVHLVERYKEIVPIKDWYDYKPEEHDEARQEGSAALMDGTTPHTSGSAYTCRLGYTRPPCTLRRMSEYRPGTGPSTASMSPSAPGFG